MTRTRFLLTASWDEQFTLTYGSDQIATLRHFVDGKQVPLDDIELKGVVIEGKAHLVPVPKEGRAPIYALCGVELNGDEPKTLKVVPCAECLGIAKEIGL